MKVELIIMALKTFIFYTDKKAIKNKLDYIKKHGYFNDDNSFVKSKKHGSKTLLDQFHCQKTFLYRDLRIKMISRFYFFKIYESTYERTC